MSGKDDRTGDSAAEAGSESPEEGEKAMDAAEDAEIEPTTGHGD